MQRHWASLGVFLILCLAVMVLGATITAPAIAGWYAGLQKPSWTPPDWIFAPVWSLLYVIMAVAAWLVWCRRQTVNVTRPLGLFALQLLLNAAWSPLFFGLQQPLAALLDIVLLCGSLVLTLVAFWRVSRWAGGILLPYLAWVIYAAGLNFAIWQMNNYS